MHLHAPMLIRSAATFVVMMLCVISPAGAAQYSVSDLVNLAQSHSPELSLLQGRLQAAQARHTNVSNWDSPELRMGYGREANTLNRFRNSEYPNHQYDASLRIFPRNPWAVGATKQRLASETEMIRLTQTEATHQLRLTVEALYWDLCYTYAEKQIKKQLVDIRKAQSKNTETLLESGQVSLEESLPAKLRLLDSIMELDTVHQREQELLAELGKLTGVSKDKILVEAPQPLSNADFKLPFDTWTALALKNRMELDLYTSSVELAEAELKEVRIADYPWVKHIQAGYEVRNDVGDRDSAGVQVAISLPMFGGRDGDKEVATATLNSQYRQREQAIKMIESEIRHLIGQFQTLEQQWIIHHTEMAPMVNELRDSIATIKEQAGENSDSYWAARIAIAELEAKELHMLSTYQQLYLKTNAALGIHAQR
ncbi:MAG: TolC family protein [Verrucomicrobiota bacterium]